MDVRLSAEQVALRDSAAQLLGDLAPRTVASLDDEARTAKLRGAVQSAGWWELRADGGDGAPLASGVEVCLIAEQMGRTLADVAFIGPSLAADAARRGADVPETAGWAPVVDLTGATAGVGDADTPPVLALGLALASADLVGVMEGATDLAVDYARERTQYGQPIGSFQAVQHLLADALVMTEGARSAALHAAWAVDALAPDDAVAAGAVAKAYATRAARTVCETAIQVHGGIGNTWECLAHVYLRRALSVGALFGDAATNVRRVLAHRGIGGAA